MDGCAYTHSTWVTLVAAYKESLRNSAKTINHQHDANARVTRSTTIQSSRNQGSWQNGWESRIGGAFTHFNVMSQVQYRGCWKTADKAAAKEEEHFLNQSKCNYSPPPSTLFQRMMMILDGLSSLLSSE